MRRIAVRFAYLGDGFSGSQIQPGVRTVEGEMRSTLLRVCHLEGDDLDLRISSRTDRGVNALGNVAAFNTGFDDPEALLRALNAVSDGVFYTAYAWVDGSFNPRHATSRGYRYVLPSRGLDIGRARECADLFVGEHDFVRFCRPDGKPTVVTVDSIDVTSEDDRIVLTYRARYFLWNMVRRTASAIAEVASGHMDLSDVRRALDGEDVNFGVSRADALTLMDVSYDDVTFTPCMNHVLSSKTDDLAFTEGLKLDFYSSLQLLDAR